LPVPINPIDESAALFGIELRVYAFLTPSDLDRCAGAVDLLIIATIT
jgi:hypothetical protein